MTRHIRFVILAAVMTAFLWPAGVSAGQGRANPRSSGGQGSGSNPRPSGGQGSSAAPAPSRSGTAVPRPPSSYRPYPSRYYYPRYGFSGYYGYRGFYGYPGFYTGFYNPYFWGSYGFGYGYGYGYGFGYPYGFAYAQSPYYGPYYYNTGSARLQVAPRNTQVYIDGYFVGVADNFDGNLQRLHVEPGAHELHLYLEGHQTFTQKVLFPRGGTLKLIHTMQPLGPGESAGPPPKPDESLRAQPSESSAVVRQGPPPRAVNHPISARSCCASGRQTPTSSSTAKCGRRRLAKISS